MREFPFVDLDAYLEDAVRAKQQLDAERWRAELRPRALRQFAALTANLSWSRALVQLVVEELYPDDLFAELVPNLTRIPERRWPQVLAITVALRHSWRRDGLTRIARRLQIDLESASDLPHSPVHTHSRVQTTASRHKARARRGGK